MPASSAPTPSPLGNPPNSKALRALERRLKSIEAQKAARQPKLKARLRALRRLRELVETWTDRFGAEAKTGAAIGPRATVDSGDAATSGRSGRGSLWGVYEGLCDLEWSQSIPGIETSSTGRLRLSKEYYQAVLRTRLPAEERPTVALRDEEPLERVRARIETRTSQAERKLERSRELRRLVRSWRSRLERFL